MAITRLNQRIAFPPVERADPDGLLAIGGDLEPERLLLAYRSGIFPWPVEEGFPLLWHSPDPRFVLATHALHVPKSLRRVVNQRAFTVTLDTAFERVIEECALAPRPGQRGTWITNAMCEAYARMFALGFAHSVEVWHGAELVGGLYGLSLGGAYFGESMFAHRPDASKVGFVTLVQQLARWGVELVDAQVHTAHLERFGAEFWPRERYLRELARALVKPTVPGPWRFDSDLPT
ncbi:MAG: leucyl/phenylalanyl-tRNA--protein transferase [Myxococcales bacterium]|nr:leucyl/phenylalanyl-tRNA--protein transferase [Myxococcales bacterium]